jgi:hypothetical protein
MARVRDRIDERAKVGCGWESRSSEARRPITATPDGPVEAIETAPERRLMDGLAAGLDAEPTGVGTSRPQRTSNGEPQAHLC